MPKFYKLQMNNGAAGEERANIVDEMLALNRITASLEHAPGFDQLLPGQLLLVHKGSHPTALVKIVRPLGEVEEPGVPSWGFNYEVTILSRYHEARRTFPELEAQAIGYSGTFQSLGDDSATSLWLQRWLEFVERQQRVQEASTLLRAKGQIILQGPPGTGKTRLALELAEAMTSARDRAGGKFQIIQFHPAYAYEDFVRGISARVGADGRLAYETENRLLAQFAELALQAPDADFVLIIDEINRANLPSVLGELIYALEYRYDPGQPQRTSVESLYALRKQVGSAIIEERVLRLPKNLYLIGTMNTADRSAGPIDYAIRRRFAFVEVPPLRSVLDEVYRENEKLGDQARGLFDAVEQLFGEGFLSGEFQKRDVQLGHSYFLARDPEALALRLEHEIKPILREYVRDGVLLASAREAIERLHV